MSFYIITPNLIANGNITEASFIKGDPTKDRAALLAGAGSSILGISQEGKELSPNPIYGSQTIYAAQANEEFMAFGWGAFCLLQADATGWSAFDFIKPNSSGLGTKASPGDVVGALALEACGANGKGRVLVTQPFRLEIGNASGLKILTVNTTLTTADAAKMIGVGAADLTLTLPSAVSNPGVRFSFLHTAATATYTAGATGTTVAVTSPDKMQGNGFTPAAGKGALNAKAATATGDRLDVISDGTDWQITLATLASRWARVA